MKKLILGILFISVAAWAIDNKVTSRDGSVVLDGFSTILSKINGTEKARVNSTGVGISQTNPKDRLHIGSQTTVGLGSAGGNEAVFAFNRYYSAGEKAISSSNRSAAIEMGNNGGFLKASTGTQTADAALTTYNSYLEWGTASDYVLLKTANTERMRIDSSGNVTVGTLSGTGVQSVSVSSTGQLTRASHPTIQKFTSGSGSYNTPSGVTYIRVRMVGGGGGGAGGGDNSGAGGNGGNGGNTTFGTSLLVANGGLAGSTSSGGGGAGGSASVSSPAIGTALAGGSGSGHLYVQDASNASQATGGSGGSSAFGGNGGGSNYNNAGSAGVANTGGGGGGGGLGSWAGGHPGAGGGAGGYVEAIITNPGASFSYSVGAGGTAGSAGTNGYAGGSGGSGYIEVLEFY